MREILFKAKRVDNGEWVEGNLILSNDAEEGWESVIIPISNSYMFVKEYEGDLGFEKWYVVDKDTICQYTGLTDKNGNKIWENDILFAKEPYIPTCPFPIRYNQETISYVGLYDGFGKEFELSKELLSCSEVIGNIFDNEDLLKGE